MCVNFYYLGVRGNDLKSLSKRTDIFAPVSSSVVAARFSIVTW